VCCKEGRFVDRRRRTQLLGAFRFGPLTNRKISRVASERSRSASAKTSGLRSVKSRCGNGNSMPCSRYKSHMRSITSLRTFAIYWISDPEPQFEDNRAVAKLL
jgi:hypothetical protein